MKKYIGILLALLVFCIQLMLIHGAGLTWDEPSSFFFGRANLDFWLTGNRSYLNDIKSPTLFTGSPFFYLYGEDVYPPFPFVVASGFSWVFAEHLHVLSIIDAHHMGEVLLSSIGVAAFYGVAIEVGLTLPIATATTLLFAFYPTIIGEMRADPKDIPLMSMITLFMYCFLRFVKVLSRRNFSKHVWCAIAAGVTLGLAFATKPTAPIILVPIFVWFVLSVFAHKSFRRAIGLISRLIPLTIIIGVIALAVFFLSWPWLWDDPVGKLGAVWHFFRTIGFGNLVTYMGGVYNAGFTLPWTYPYAALAAKTPIELLALAVAGMFAVWAFFRRGNSYALLAFFWFWLLILRFLVPGMVIYDQVRHYIDAMPGFFLLIGFGLQWVGSLDSKKIWKMLTVIVFLFAFSHELFIMAWFYPYEPTYYNAFVGGIKTVSVHKLFDVEHLGAAVKEGIDFVNTQPGNSSVYVCQITHLAYFYTAPSVKAVRIPKPGSYVLIPSDYGYFGRAINWYTHNAKLVYTVSRDGGDLLYVYHVTVPNPYYCGPESDTVLPLKYQ